MKRIAILMVTVLLGLSATASSVHYFTRSQAERAVNYLNRQNELMIYCGYDYEIETYVLINEIWAERINSAYYELWIYGYDAYTGDEIYMPLELQCVWLYGAGHMYNAAQYLRFRATVRTPSIRWFVPPYHPYTRVMHRPGFVRSYHYDIHCHGWMPPSHPAYHGPHHHPHHPLPPYYDRTPQAPAPAPTTAWTPGVDRPQISTTQRTTSGGTSTTRSTSGTANETRSSGTPANTRTNSGTTNSNTRSTSGTSTNTRSTSGTSTSTRSTSGSSTSNTRSTSGSSTSTRSTGTTPTRSNTGTTAKSDNEPKTTSRLNSSATPTRSTSNNTISSRSSNNTTTTRSSNTTSTRSTGTTGTRTTSGSATNRR